MKAYSVCLALLVCNVLYGANFQTGLEAYKRGDFAAALKEWQPLAEQGDANSQYNLGMLYARGQGVPQDYPKAIDWYQKAAAQGVAAAQYNLGVIYANGQGVPPNAEEARKWFLQAANQGVGNAAEGLGNIYHESGAFQNAAEAEKWYRQAAERGVASAAFHLGVMYDVGQGVTKNYDEALKWYHKAADAGYPAAMTNLGILYYNAQGVKRDLVQAYAWFARADKNGDPRAKEMIPIAASKMTPALVKKAQAAVDEWQPSSHPPVIEANLFKAAPASPAADQSADRQPAPAPGAAVTSNASAPGGIQSVWTGVARVVAIGDIHGDFEQFVQVLRSAQLVDDYGNWTGGKTHLVQTGDVVDRGPDSRAVMDLLTKLEKQAAAAGGGVHCLIGNHEAMDVYGDLRFVSPGEYSSYRTEGSDASRAASYASYRQTMSAAAKPELNRAQWESDHPPGFVEHRAAFAPDGVYGKWIRSHNAVIKIDRTLFVHAGLGPKYADWSIDKINGEVRRELNDLTSLHGGIVTDEDGPLWYAGLAKGDEAALQQGVERLLKHFDVDRIVIGHSYADAAITPRFGGRVVMIDIGISRAYDNVGKVGCLEIDGGKAFALHRGHKLDLPSDESGPAMLQYLQQAAALDPQPSPLAQRIEKLEKK